MSLKNRSIPRFFKPPKTSYFLFGPRGTGKSTMIRQTYRHALWIDLLDQATAFLYQTHPERLRQLIEARPSPSTIVIDEIQKAPEVLDTVHSLVESKRGHQFILTGSSARKLKRTGANLLGGRSVLRHLHPFMAAELGGDFNLAQALKDGLLPLIAQAGDPSDTLNAYVALYMREEVQNEGLVRRMAHFGRFLESISFSHASLINFNAVARDCGVDRKTAESYVGILKDLLLAYEIPVFTKRAKRELIKHSKFYFFDPGVFRALRPRGPLDHPHEIDGQALEGLVAEHLRSWNDYGEHHCTISFWRTRSGVEVDFVVYGASSFCAIEVKNATRIRSDDLRGLNSFLEDYPEASAILLYRGKDKLKQGKILCWPCEDFLRELKPDKPILR